MSRCRKKNLPFRQKTASQTGTLFLLFFCLLSTGCASLQESSKYDFSEGIYKAKFSTAPASRVYVDIKEDTLTLYPVLQMAQTIRIDTLKRFVLEIHQEKKVQPQRVYSFSKPSFDIDVLTIPFKYRPGMAGIPNQLITTFQGAIYLGVRNDLFRIGYKNTPLQDYRRSFNHFGYSFGFFTGLGASTINETVTKNQLPYEYDGVVSLNGIAGIIGVNKITLGLAIGIDHLLDKNRQNWIYQHKPWVGLAFGLNLN